jgi:ABC-2 type transport system ATP-binding protein
MLEIKNVTRQFHGKGGIKKINLSITPGQIIAVVGPNGAGKSTLFSVISGIANADTGECLLDDILTSAYEPGSIGFLTSEPFLINQLTPVQMLDFFSSMKKLNLRKIDIDAILQSFGIKDFYNSKIGTLSQGMYKRVAIACTLIGSPRLVILDEPLNGLDIQSVINLKEELFRLKERGAITLISSHILDFLDNIADTVVFLQDGEIARIISVNGSSSIEEEYKSVFIK